MIEVRPATVDQVQRALSGELVVIDADAGSVAENLRRIDRALSLRYDPVQKVSVVVHVDGDEENLVTTQQGKPDQRLVKRVEEISAPGYDYGREVEKVERDAERAQDARRREQTGEIGERLAHALRKDLHVQNRAFID
jgi:hypothetical protein